MLKIDSFKIGSAVMVPTNERTGVKAHKATVVYVGKTTGTTCNGINWVDVGVDDKVLQRVDYWPSSRLSLIKY